MSLVTIVIPNWNGKDMLENCLENIREYTDYNNYRIVVVDNGSSDGSVDMIKNEFNNILLIENEENRGFGPANNQAFDQYPNTEYFLLLNNDIRITEKGWLTKFVNITEDKSADIVGCRLEYPDGSLQHGGAFIRPGWLPVKQIKSDTEPVIRRYGQKVWEPDYVTGAAFLIRKEVIDSLQGFDEVFVPAYFEETDLCMRAKNNGYRILYTPSPSLIHVESKTASDMPTYWFHNQLRFVILNFPLHWIMIQIVFQIRAIASHLYNGRSLSSIYLPVISNIHFLIVHRIHRSLKGKD